MASASSPEPIESMDAAAIEAGLPSFSAETLAGLIRRTNREYWDAHAPTIPDPLYDRLVEALRRLDSDHPALAELGESVPEGPAIEADATREIPPAQRLGAPVRHTRSMLSLDKCYSGEELEAWAQKFEGGILVMPKMDGVACSLRYTEAGELFLAATRGSGSEGEDITINALEVTDIPAQLNTEAGAKLFAGRSLAIEVRGELFMRILPLCSCAHRDLFILKVVFTRTRNNRAAAYRPMAIGLLSRNSHCPLPMSSPWRSARSAPGPMM